MPEPADKTPVPNDVAPKITALVDVAAVATTATDSIVDTAVAVITAPDSIADTAAAVIAAPDNAILKNKYAHDAPQIKLAAPRRIEP